MRYSLSTKISVVFAIAFGLVCILFITFGRIQLNQAFDRMTVSQINSINYLLGLYERKTPPENLDEYFSNFNLTATKDKNLISNVLTRGDIYSPNSNWRYCFIKISKFYVYAYKKSKF